MKKVERHPEIKPTHPGFIIAEVIAHLGIGKAEMARRLGIARSALYNVLDEKSALSADMAVRFEKETGTSAGLLIRMQGDLDIWRARRALDAA